MYDLILKIFLELKKNFLEILPEIIQYLRFLETFLKFCFSVLQAGWPLLEVSSRDFDLLTTQL